MFVLPLDGSQPWRRAGVPSRMILRVCDSCMKARGGPARIGPQLALGTLGARCDDCGAGWCMWCRTLDEAKRHRPGGRPCALVGSTAIVGILYAFRVAEIDHDAPTVRALPDVPSSGRLP